MLPSRPDQPEPLTGAATTYFARVLPVGMAVMGGAVTAAAWLDLLGDAPAPAAVKWGILLVWAGVSAAMFRFLWPLPRVWRDGDELIVGEPPRGLRIHLSEVEDVRETRFQNMKWITLDLRRPTPLGRTIRFVPRGVSTFFLPILSSPVAAELREHRRRLLSGG